MGVILTTYPSPAMILQAESYDCCKYRYPPCPKGDYRSPTMHFPGSEVLVLERVHIQNIIDSYPAINKQK